MNQEESPFEVPGSEREICRMVEKDGKRVLILSAQMFNYTIQAYTEPLFWPEQW